MVLALSGKCCSGKNYVCSRLEKYGFETIDVDLVAREVFNDSTDKIIELFGESILESGVISRKLVGDIVFSDSNKRAQLESLLHPLTYEKIYSIIEDSDRDWIINIPILKDETLISRCDGVIWIKSPLLLRFYRAMSRDNYSISTVIGRIISQRKLSAKYLKPSVDIYYIYNSWFSIGLKKSINGVLNRLQRG